MSDDLTAPVVTDADIAELKTLGFGVLETTGGYECMPPANLSPLPLLRYCFTRDDAWHDAYDIACRFNLIKQKGAEI